MSDTKIINEVKRHVTGGRTAPDLARDPAKLELAGYDGIMWASNRYWLTPAARVAPLLKQYNLDAGKPGRFEVNSTIRQYDDGGPDFVRQMDGALTEFTEPAAAVQLGGRDAYVRTADGRHDLAVYQTAAGTLMGLPPDDLAWLSEMFPVDHRNLSVALGLGPDDHFGPVRIMTKGHGAAPVVLAADVIRTVKPGGYGPAGEDERESAWIPAVTENLGARVIGMMMATRLDGTS